MPNKKITNKLFNRPKIGLALGSGGSKGLAHIGVIKVLEANKIPIDFIAGASIGAVIGGLYAATKNIKKVEEIADANNKKKFFSMAFDFAGGGGFIGGDKIETYINEIIDGADFKKLKIPFAAVATDLKSGKPVVINKGNLASAIRASISVPLVFKPVKRKNHLLVDGGLSAPVPVKILRDMGADLVIGVNLDAHCFYHDHDHKLGFNDVIRYTTSILRSHLSALSAKEADILVTPHVHNPSLIGWSDFVKAKKIVKKGEDEMWLLMPELKAQIKERTH